MGGFLLDTNVISEPQRPRPSPNVVAWLDAQRADALFITAVNVGELAVGIAILQPGRRRLALEEWLTDVVERRFEGRVLAFDADAARVQGDLAAWARAAGRTTGPADAQIAAIASWHDLTVVTRDVVDFAALGVPIVDPWAARSSGREP